MMNNAYNNLNSLINQFTKAAAAAQKVMMLSDTLPDVVTKHTANTDKSVEMHGAIDIEQLGFFYQMRPEKQILHDVNLHVPPATTCAFVGRSGGGKCFKRGTRLRLYNGETIRVEDVRGGMKLMGDNGAPRTVTVGSVRHYMQPVTEEEDDTGDAVRPEGAVEQDDAAIEDRCYICLGKASMKLPTLVCDGLGCDGRVCNRECHLPCHTPPCQRVPRGEWYCDQCQVGLAGLLPYDMLMAEELAALDDMDDDEKESWMNSNAAIFRGGLGKKSVAETREGTGGA